MKEFAMTHPYLTAMTIIIVAYFVCQSAVWIFTTRKK